ncbi:hypothetical protein A6C57_01185 [Fibrella sp. ES10-3-2-2]|nr:hypothetical protein A6C57_01185 [Fibrella sp. ES10-3-2-2]
MCAARAGREPKTNRRITSKRGTIRGFLSFGPDDMLPDRLIEVVKTSRVGRACASKRASFIAGNGWADRVLAETIINHKGETMDDLLDHIKWQMSFFQTVALLVSYNVLGQITGVKHVDVELVRYADYDETGELHYAGYFPFLCSSINVTRKKEHILLPLFDPRPDVVQQQIIEAGGISKYRGQILYAAMREPGDGVYHEPDYYACIDDMQTDAELSLYDRRTVTNGFNLSGAFAYWGGAEDTETVELDKDGQPINSRSDDEGGSIEALFEANLGNDGTGNVMTIRTDTPEEVNSMKWFDFTGTNLADRYKSTAERIPVAITQAWSVPNELVNLRRTGGLMPTGQENEIAYKLMHESVNGYQRHVRRQLERVVRHWRPGTFQEGVKLEIENLNYFADMPTGTPGNAPAAVMPAAG